MLTNSKGLADAPGPDGRHFAVWRALLPPDAAGAPGGAAAALAGLRAARGPWAVLLSSGGHFAAAVINPRPSPGQHPKGKGGPAAAGPPAAGEGRVERPGDAGAPGPLAAPAAGGGGAVRSAGGAGAPLDVLAHKTFHRYVVRSPQALLHSLCGGFRVFRAHTRLSGRGRLHSHRAERPLPCSTRGVAGSPRLGACHAGCAALGGCARQRGRWWSVRSACCADCVSPAP